MNYTHPSHDQHHEHSGTCCAAHHDEVARAAFTLYERQGSQDGHDVRNWLDAEAHVQAQHASTVHGRPTTGRIAKPTQR